ncbi:lipopolysaccharide biosynthesis protein [Pseudomonas edaphica]|uniref:Lipopolysaccharide biosynthesis protein n=1 Tax=Pseudomonas edaphica TaxID=2006980 RepID=A0A7Y7RVE2_9PSED|nr:MULTISPECIES: rhamnan synthesis F family protein [Pseudomonas]NMX54597.1 lipopolysaccharide biosynthesis protein [Pseudomonas sp. WS 5146]NVZ58115.1 lipopolysaccharide biosynthesis protein [Pseudomonas edaphica]
MRRVAFYLFYDNDGIVDDYIIYKLRMLRAHVETIFFVSNSSISPDSLIKINSLVDVVHCRVNKGFDVWAYKEAIETFGWDQLRQYDEAIFLNYTFFGPIFPFAELFEEMNKPGIDFWGVSSHQEITPNPFNGTGTLHYHIQSHFIAVRKNMLNSDGFYRYWTDMPMINSYEDSILKHEARFTKHFSDLGFNYAVSIGPETYNTDHPIFSEMDLAIERRSPILKRRPFFHDPVFIESEAIDVKRALDLISEKSDYDVSLIWKNLIRTTPLRTLYSNLEVLSVLSESQVESENHVSVSKKIAVIAHVYYVDMLDEMLGYIKNIPAPFSIYITTDTAEKKVEIDTFFSAFPDLKCTVLVCESNFGRDTSALLITCREVVLAGGYDLICRLHSKKSPQDGYSKSAMFKRHLCENLLASPAYVRNVIDMFESQPWIGVAMPPVVHIGYPTLGHGWFLNRDRAINLARELNFKVPIDHETPIATYGSMYWFRPEALKKLFQHEWSWKDFDEAHYGDGDLPHVLERLITYCAQDAGFLSRCILTPKQASKNYVKLEYKLQALSSCFSTGSLREQMQTMQLSKTSQITYITTGVIMSLKRSIMFRYPRLGSVLRRAYKWASSRR